MNWDNIYIFVQVAAGKRKAAVRMEKMNVGRSTNVGFVHSNSASLKLLVDT